MSSVPSVMAVYPVATAAMADALAHDRDASETAYRHCRVLLRGRDSGAVGVALDGWRTALDELQWTEVSTRLWQLMCALPVGFPPDQSTLPPPAGAKPRVVRACPEHGSAPRGTWWAFCPRCGTSLLLPAGSLGPTD